MKTPAAYSMLVEAAQLQFWNSLGSCCLSSAVSRPHSFQENFASETLATPFLTFADSVLWDGNRPFPLNKTSANTPIGCENKKVLANFWTRRSAPCGSKA